MGMRSLNDRAYGRAFSSGYLCVKQGTGSVPLGFGDCGFEVLNF